MNIFNHELVYFHTQKRLTFQQAFSSISKFLIIEDSEAKTIYCFQPSDADNKGRSPLSRLANPANPETWMQ
jgi:hypothetical protein